MEKRAAKNNQARQPNADRIDIICYTDPLCCWSWAMEPELRKLQELYKDRLGWRYCMGGLLPDWNSYSDTLNDITRPAQMGPAWMEAQRISGVPVYDRIWIDNPPASSYPACIAVKCAGLQSDEMANVFLLKVREAIMLDGKNIALRSVLHNIADAMERQYRYLFNADRFKADLLSDAPIELFRADLQETRNNNISRFPTLTIAKPGAKGIMIVGYKPFAVLNDAVLHVCGS